MTKSFIRMGHRGAAAYATENTLSSIQTAISYGVDMVEMDIRRTKDGVLVLAHEPFVRGRGHTRSVHRSTYLQLKQLCLPGGEVIPTLEEALTFIAGKVNVNLDLKEAGYEAAVVAMVKRLKLDRQVMFSSLNKRSLRAVKSVDAKLYVTLSLPSSALVRLYDVRWIKPIVHYMASHRQPMRIVHFTMRQLLPLGMRKLAHEQIDAVIIRAPLISPRLVELAHQKELHLYAWPADKPEDATKLHQLGVDGIASNRPDIFEAVELAHQ